MTERTDALKNIKDDSWLLVKKYLEYSGFFHDEQKGIPFGSTLMEHCVVEIESKLRDYGYTGGPLVCSAKYYPEHGAVYSIFDSDRLEVTEIFKHLDKWVANYDK